jgi:hypothetical protein
MILEFELYNIKRYQALWLDYSKIKTSFLVSKVIKFLKSNLYII